MNLEGVGMINSILFSRVQKKKKKSSDSEQLTSRLLWIGNAASKPPKAHS